MQSVDTSFFKVSFDQSHLTPKCSILNIKTNTWLQTIRSRNMKLHSGDTPASNRGRHDCDYNLFSGQQWMSIIFVINNISRGMKCGSNPKNTVRESWHKSLQFVNTSNCRMDHSRGLAAYRRKCGTKLTRATIKARQRRYRSKMVYYRLFCRRQVAKSANSFATSNVGTTPISVEEITYKIYGQPYFYVEYHLQCKH